MPPLDNETKLGLALFAAAIGLLIAGVVAFMPDTKPDADPKPDVVAAKVWDAPSQGFLNALAAAGVTAADDTSAENLVATGQALCARFTQPQANKEDLAAALHWGQGGMTQAQAVVIVEAANTNLCPAAVVPAVAVPVPVRVPNVPNVPNPPNVSTGGGSSSGGGESRFCRKRWWC